MHYIQNLEKNPFLKALKGCSDDYEPSPLIIVTGGYLRALKQRDKCIYICLSLRTPSYKKRKKTQKVCFLK
jgi:hypothetical protein